MERRAVLVYMVAMALSKQQARGATFFPLNRRLVRDTVELQILATDTGLMPTVKCSDPKITHAIVTAFYEAKAPGLTNYGWLLLSEIRIIPCVNETVDCAGDLLVKATAANLRWVKVETLSLCN